jgi:glycosyltransferase involved in cell wall biosynthesis
MVHLPVLVPPPDVPEKPGVEPKDRPYFLYVGRLEKLKGVQDLLRLFREYRETDLLIAGTGSFEPSLKEQARGLDHVRFLGALHPGALGPLYRGAVAALVPSLCYETFGLTAAEAMSHGTPVIVRRIGALAETLEESGGGLAFATLQECREAMEALRTQPELRERLGRSGQEAVGRLWSPEVHLRQYLGLLDSLLAGRRSRRAEPGIAAHA